MRASSKLQTTSKYMSYLLRHKPEDARLTLDKEGWCDLEQFVANAGLEMGKVLDIVANDDKTRFAIREMDGRRYIRANQGHTTDVSIDFPEADPPATLYHGTTAVALPSIMESGIFPMKRHHVHLSEELATARKVGDRRKGDTVILRIDAAAMVEDGFSFYISENGVWLVDSVPSRYITAL